MIHHRITRLPTIRSSLSNQSTIPIRSEHDNNNNNAGDSEIQPDFPQPVYNTRQLQATLGSLSGNRHVPSISRSRRRRRARMESQIARRVEARANRNSNNNQANDIEAMVGIENDLNIANHTNNENNENHPPNNNSFTFLEHIGMLGARNFFIPSVPTRSTQCIECYKRAGFYLCMILIISGALFLWNAAIHPFHMMGRRFFIEEKYESMFLTDEDFYPIAPMLTVYLTIILSGFALHYTHTPLYDHGFCMYVHSARALILFGFVSLVWHIWSHAAHYPDASFPTELEAVMRVTLDIAKENRKHEILLGEVILPIENVMWRDTQTVFKCCGVNDFHDWLPRSNPMFSHALELAAFNFSKFVPKSCCEKLVADSCEALYVQKTGCLEAQLKVLHTEALWVINPGMFVSVLGHFALYLILGRLFSNTVALTRTRRPFEPPPPTRVEERPPNNLPQI